MNFGIVKRLLILASDVANGQVVKNQQNKEVALKGEQVIYEGLELLIDKIIYEVYSQAVKDETVNIANRLAVFRKAKSIFGVHRMNNFTVMNIKATVKHLIESNGISRREATVSSLSNAFILYIVIVSFNFFRKR